MDGWQVDGFPLSPDAVSSESTLAFELMAMLKMAQTSFLHSSADRCTVTSVRLRTSMINAVGFGERHNRVRATRSDPFEIRANLLAR
jgi:hypothetical protein